MTLLEAELYRAVRPIELVGAAWTKKDKTVRSPQLLRLTNHSTNMTYWLERRIVEAGNFDERVALMNRMIEVRALFFRAQQSSADALTGSLSSAGDAGVRRAEQLQRPHRVLCRLRFVVRLPSKALLGQPRSVSSPQPSFISNPQSLPFQTQSW